MLFLLIMEKDYSSSVIVHNFSLFESSQQTKHNSNVSIGMASNASSLTTIQIKSQTPTINKRR